MTQAVHKAAVSSKRAGGSLATQRNRRLDSAGLLRFAREIGELYPSLEDVPEWVIHLYAQYCAAQGKAPGTLANIFSAIRVLNAVATKNVHPAPTNRSLGIDRRERKGRKRALTEAEIALFLERARSSDDGIVHIVGIARVLGLRRKEALMCAYDLPMWLEALARGDTTVRVMRGAKNGRPRQVRIIQARREQTQQIITSALAYAEEHNFRLIHGKNTTLEGSMGRLTFLIQRLGMSGEKSFHALRYTYALESANELLESGTSPYETLVQLSECLGHGRSRTQMILNHYCQPIRDRFEGCPALARKDNKLRPAPPRPPRSIARLDAKSLHATLSGYPIGKATDQPANRHPDEHSHS
ncbi:integrase domain-containing protein [Paraburkholderia edwinii]|jgi:integrase|uniref:Integrase domain-containing protein n=2 Tax=Paraburkholderia edwinii TaxID=2861782 RepID=A0ABX8UVK3_9BURK|nr:integrase domain-containing protein [Paraburkholderia edwinii]